MPDVVFDTICNDDPDEKTLFVLSVHYRAGCDNCIQVYMYTGIQKYLYTFPNPGKIFPSFWEHALTPPSPSRKRVSGFRSFYHRNARQSISNNHGTVVWCDWVFIKRIVSILYGWLSGVGQVGIRCVLS